MNQRLLPAALITAFCCLLNSCVPFPTSTPVFPPLMGSVVSGEGFAITNATVTVTRAGYVRHGVTDANGKFNLPGALQFHYAMNAGTSGVTPPPWHWRKPPQDVILSVSAPGYMTATQTFPAHKDKPAMVILPDRIKVELFTDGGQAQPVP